MSPHPLSRCLGLLALLLTGCAQRDRIVVGSRTSPSPICWGDRGAANRAAHGAPGGATLPPGRHVRVPPGHHVGPNRSIRRVHGTAYTAVLKRAPVADREQRPSGVGATAVRTHSPVDRRAQIVTESGLPARGERAPGRNALQALAASRRAAARMATCCEAERSPHASPNAAHIAATTPIDAVAIGDGARAFNTACRPSPCTRRRDRFGPTDGLVAHERAAQVEASLHGAPCAARFAAPRSPPADRTR